MVTLQDIVNEGIIDAQIGVNVYEFNDMNGQLLYGRNPIHEILQTLPQCTSQIHT